jgi:hypothetical protein
VEGFTTYAFRKNLIFHYRYRGEGPAIAFTYNVNSNFIWDFVFDGGTGIAMYGPEGTEQKENTFQQGEIRGGVCSFQAIPDTAHDNTMTSVGFIGPRPTRGNQVFAPWDDLTGAGHGPPITGQAVITNFANNDVDYDLVTGEGTVKFARLLDDWTPTDVP